MADFRAVISKLRSVAGMPAADKKAYLILVKTLEETLKQGNGIDASFQIRKIKSLLPIKDVLLKKQLSDLEKECSKMKKTGHALAPSELRFSPRSGNEKKPPAAERKIGQQRQSTPSGALKGQQKTTTPSSAQGKRMQAPTPSIGSPKLAHAIPPKKKDSDLKPVLEDLKAYSKKFLTPEENRVFLADENQRERMTLRIIERLEGERNEAKHRYDALVGDVRKLNSLIETSTKPDVKPRSASSQSDSERLETSIIWLIDTFERASATKGIAVKAEQKKAGSKGTEIWVSKLEEKVIKTDFKFSFSKNDVRDESQRTCLNNVLRTLSFQKNEIDTNARELAETKSKLDDFKKSIRFMRKEMFGQDDHVDVTGSVEKCKAEVLELHKHLLKQMQRMTDELQQLDVTKATPAERKPSSKRNNDDVQMVCSQFKKCFKDTDMLLKRLQKSFRCFREEIGSFDNEIDHWSDLIEVEHKEGPDSEFCVALRRLREKTFKQKKQCLLISENMRIADDKLKQLQIEVIEWEQLGTVDNLQNPKKFPLAFAVNETRIEIVNIKKRQQGSFEAKKVFKSLCKYILDEEVKQKGGEPISSEEPDAEACFSCIQRWKEDRQNTQRFVEEIYPLLQSSLTSLKSEPYLFHEPKKRKDVKLYSKFCADVQICVHQLVDYIEFNAERFATSYIDFSKAVRLLGEHYSALTSEEYQMPKKETSYEIIIQNITDRLVQLGITKRQLTVLVDEKNSLALRLSKAAGAKLRENNPNIADLSDPNRPTKISERYSELYDNQWTNAFEKLIDGNRCTEKRAIDSLLEIFKEAFLFCTDISNTQTHLLKSTILCPVQDLKSSHIGANDQRLSSEHAVMISELRKGTVDDSIIDLQKHFKKKHPDFADSATKIFTDECVRLCWMMCVQTPPLWVDFQTKSDDSFNKNVYKSYTATGPKVEYVVWPALYLHHGGGLLLKGVAQGKASRK